MAGRRWAGFLLAVFLTGSVIVQGGFIPLQPPRESRVEKLYHIFTEMNTKGSQNHTENSLAIGKCFICHKVVAAIERILEHRIRKRTVRFCCTLRRKFKVKCLKLTKKYKDMLLNAIFPEGANGTCVRMGHCREQLEFSKADL